MSNTIPLTDDEAAAVREIGNVHAWDIDGIQYDDDPQQMMRDAERLTAAARCHHAAEARALPADLVALVRGDLSERLEDVTSTLERGPAPDQIERFQAAERGLRSLFAKVNG